MSDTLARTLEAFEYLQVLVIGEAMLDSYLQGESRRLCQEAPVPIVSLEERREAPGGAANTAANVRSLGAEAWFLSVVGDDAEGQAVLRALDNHRVSAEHVLVARGRRTLAKNRILAGSQLLVRFDQGDTSPLCGDLEEALLDRLTLLYPKCDAVIISDYAYGVLTPRIIAKLAELQALMPRIVVGDSKRLKAYQDVGLTAVKPNYEQALELLGSRPPGDWPARAEGLAAYGERVLDVAGARIAAVTLDSDGALIFERGRPPYRTYAQPHPASRAAGAGDTFVSAFSLALAAGGDTPSAAELASAAAGIVVGKDGTACCSAVELLACLSGREKPAAGLAQLLVCLQEHRRKGKRIVFTNGCFDILHRGHVTYLSQAKALGDVLVVGVNSDESIRRLKGPTRPINALDDRIQVLAALSCVDHIIPFEEETPHNLIRAIRPEVFVKGGDYTRDRLPEASLVEQLGGVVQILPFLEARSTTGLIERIRSDEVHVNGVNGNHGSRPRTKKTRASSWVTNGRNGGEHL